MGRASSAKNSRWIDRLARESTQPVKREKLPPRKLYRFFKERRHADDFAVGTSLCQPWNAVGATRTPCRATSERPSTPTK